LLKATSKIKWICKLIHASVKDQLDAPLGAYELLGVDFMFDAAGNPYILEMNMNPALFCDTDVQTQVIPVVMKGVVEIVLSSHNNIVDSGVYCN